MGIYKTGDEIRGAIEWADTLHPTLSIPAINILQALAEEYLKIEGWPEEKEIKIKDSIDYEAQGFNEALRLCSLAAMKEKSKADIKCPFCSEDDFDLIGLKHHLLNYCIKIIDIKTIREA